MSDLNYAKSGVNIDEGNRFVSLIGQMVDSTRTAGVMGGLGGFAGLFSLKAFKDMKEPVLVSGTDGVGTKLRVAIMTEKLDTVGIDLVAMCVNDIIVTGAAPLFFLDYIATGKLHAGAMADIVKGIAEACKQTETALIGGETAEMPGMYGEGDFDLAGFAVGIVDRKDIIDGSTIRPNDVIIGLPASGFHSNGYSLLRTVFFETLGLKPEDPIDGGTTVADLLLTPTKLYPTATAALKTANVPVKGMVHITGGGFYENVPRILPKGLGARFDVSGFPDLLHYRVLKERTDIEPHELYRVFNMGIGYIVIVDPADADAAVAGLKGAGEEPRIVGTVTGDGTIVIDGVDS